MLKKWRLREAQTRTSLETHPEASRTGTVIPRGLTIKGALTAQETVVVRGLMEGTIIARQNEVTIEAEGRLKGSLVAKVIIVEGRVEGDLYGDERVIVCQTSDVQGNVYAPQICLVDSCKFSGAIDMDTKARASAVNAIVKARSQKKKALSRRRSTNVVGDSQ